MRVLLVLIMLVWVGCGDDSTSSPTTNNSTTPMNNSSNSQSNNGTSTENNQTSGTNNPGNNPTNNPTNNSTNNATNNPTNNSNNGTNNPTNNNTNSPDSLYVSSGLAYETGPLQTQRFNLESGDSGAPRDITILAPSAPGTYAVVAFHHGFILRSTYYVELLTHLASHGFIVVAPQMGTSAFGAPTVETEADQVEAVYSWMQTSLATVTGVTPSFDHFGVAGHSRGAKVAWTILRREPTLYKGIVGLDPVDGTGGPGGNQPRVANTPFPVSLPTLVLGTGLGPTGFQACAPEGDNYEQFMGASITATQVVAGEYGHNDMLDANNSCGFTCSLCASGPTDGGLRLLTKGTTTLLLRSALQGRTADYAAITGSIGQSGIQTLVLTK